MDNKKKLLQEERPLQRFRGGGPRGGEVKLVLAYPNRYWLAMSNLGFQTVYKLFSEQPRFSVERAYLPEEDNEQITTFESQASLSSAEILALSVSFETDYPYVLRMLEAGGVDLSRGEEQQLRPLIIGGGAALTLNPEPLANFFDAIVIGEGEEVVDEISRCYLDARDNDASFDELLISLAQIEGVYVPSLYTPHYNDDGTLQGYVAHEAAPQRVARRYIKDIDKYPTNTVIQTPNTEFKAMFMTETGRGCEVGCKFCVAGYMYRPVRKRSAEVIRETLQVGMENAESIGFVGAAVSSHPKISELASEVAREGKRAALSSIMSQKVTPKLASSLSESEYKTVALAPEAGTEELRFRIGKRVCNEQLVEGVAALAKEGIRNFKLYFMVGLPSETKEDVVGIATLVEQAQQAALEAAREQEDFSIAPKIILSVNPFIPKAWTPFQRHEFLGFKELKRRLASIRSRVQAIPNVTMKHESPRESYFQVVLSRGDRRVGDVLAYMHEHGHDWRWLVSNRTKSLVPEVPAADFYVERRFGEDEVFPWEVIDMHIKRSLLERQYLRTFDEDVTPLIERALRARAQNDSETGASCSL